MANATFSAQKVFLEQLLNIDSSSDVRTFINSTYETQLLNIAYERSAYAYDWPGLHVKSAIVVRVNDNRYSLPASFRKFDFVYLQDVLCQEVDLLHLYASQNKYVVDVNASDIVFSTTPGTATTAYTLSNAETAGNAVTIELNTVTGLAVGDVIWIDGTTTDEFTVVTAVSSANTTITARLKNNQSGGDILYRIKELVYFTYWRTITEFTGSGTENSLLPDATDLVVPFYAAYLYHKNLEDDTKAQTFLRSWQEQLAEVWRGLGKTSSGNVTEFAVF